MNELFRLSHLKKQFDGRTVLDIAALTLESGSIYGLLGPNGAGKTTLMRILSFLDTASSGDILFEGNKVTADNAAAFRARVVWVPQSPVMFTGSLLYNVEFPLRIKGVPKKVRQQKALELLEMVHLSGLAKAPAHKLSGGEAQRGSIARALAAGANVIFFDEPTGNVDYRSREELIVLIKELWQLRKLSILITTHDQDLASELCQKNIYLFDGRLATSHWRQQERKNAQNPCRVKACLEADGRIRLMPLEGKPTGSQPSLFLDPSDSPFVIAGFNKEDETLWLTVTGENFKRIVCELPAVDCTIPLKLFTLGTPVFFEKQEGRAY